MTKLYKTTLLITMAVVTWKVWKIESYLKSRNADLVTKQRKCNQYLQTRKFLNSLSKVTQNDIRR